MSALRSRIARALLGLYPAAWRARYGDEIAELLAERGAPNADLLDLAMVGIRLRVSSLRPASGGLSMFIGPAHRHPTAFALTAFAVMLPTAAFVILSLLGHELGLTAIAHRVDPLITAVTASRIVDLALVAAPALALVLAVVPLLEVGMRNAPGSRVATVALQLRVANLAVAAVALIVGALLLGHAFAETVLRSAG